MKRTCSYWSLALLLALWVAGCVPTAAPSQKRSLTIWGQNIVADKWLQAVVRSFEDRHPDIEVRVLNFGANPQKLMTSIVGNVPPDIVWADRFTVSDWASRGAFRPLDDLIARDKDQPLGIRSTDFYPAAWNEATYIGKTYAIPTAVDDRILYWNRKVFRDNATALRSAGLDPERAPRTWSEMLAYSKALTASLNKKGPGRYSYAPNFGNSWLYLYAFQNNAEFLKYDAKGEGRTCTLDSPAAGEALQYMMDCYDVIGGYEKFQGFSNSQLGKEQDPFITGSIAMKIDGDWILNDLSRYGANVDFGVAPPPVPDDRYNHRGRFAKEKDTFVTWSGGWSYVIPKGAKHVDDAWEFIKLYSSKEGALIGAQEQSNFLHMSGRVFIPHQIANIGANRAVYERFRPPDIRFAAALKQHEDLMNSSRMRPATFAGQVLWDEHVRAVEQACTRRASIGAALHAGQVKVQHELDQVYQRDNYPVADTTVPTVAVSIGLLALALYCAYRVWRLRMAKPAREETFWAYAFVSPWFLGFVTLTLGPMLISFYLSFTQYNVFSPPRWVGLRNYSEMATTDADNVLKAFSNVFYLAGVGVPLGVVSGLAVALLLNAGVRGMATYRTFFFLPSIVPAVASAVLWIWLLTPDPQQGLINAAWMATITKWMQIQPPGWLSAEAWAKPALVLMGIWGAGSGMILWLAGLKGIPASLYEAASMDGASPSQQFWKITMPQLSPIIFFNVVMGGIGALQEFGRVFVLSGGTGRGPGDSLLTPVSHLFSNGFSYFRMGYASALAWAIFFCALALTLIQFKLAPRWVHNESGK